MVLHWLLYVGLDVLLQWVMGQGSAHSKLDQLLCVCESVQCARPILCVVSL